MSDIYSIQKDLINKNIKNDSTLNQLRSDIINLLGKNFYCVKYMITGEIIAYKQSCNTLIGRTPIYKKEFQVESVVFNKDTVFDLIMNPYVYETEYEAQEKANELNIDSLYDSLEK